MRPGEHTRVSGSTAITSYYIVVITATAEGSARPAARGLRAVFLKSPQEASRAGEGPPIRDPPLMVGLNCRDDLVYCTPRAAN